VRSPIAAGLCLLAACASVSDRVDEDRDALDELLAPELAEGLAAGEAEDLDARAAVAELLAGGVDEAVAVKVAVLANGRVRARLAELGVASAEVVQAGLVRNPVFTVQTRLFDGGTQVEASLMQSFVDLFLLSSRKRTARAQAELAGAEIARELTALGYDVRRACVAVRAADALVELERAHLTAAGSGQELMTGLFEAGNVTAASAAHEDLARARAHAELARALDRAREARESLAALMGLAGDEPAWHVAGALELPEVGAWPKDVEAAALEASFELRAGRAHVRALAERADVAGVEAALATASLGLSFEREFESGEWGIGPALSISVPIFDTGAARGAASAFEIAAELERQHQLAVEVRVAARRLRERERSLTAQLAHVAEVERPAAEAYLGAVLQDYNSMQIAAFDVLRARAEELESERAWVEALARAWTARLELRELLDGVLREPPGRESRLADLSARRGRSMPGGR